MTAVDANGQARPLGFRSHSAGEWWSNGEVARLFDAGEISEGALFGERIWCGSGFAARDWGTNWFTPLASGS